ncbi:YggS family pyridoxal phosphate-dependent enzyme [soil metagenome]
MTEDRREELRANLASTQRQIGEACIAAGRDAREVHLIVVTKTYPASDVILLQDLGVTDVGENRHPEAGDKHAEVDAPLTWHFIGGLQTNKAAAVTAYADVVHSVDRLKLVTALSKGAVAHHRDVTCLVQVRLSETEGRAGALPDDAVGVAEAIASAPGLVLGGVMGVAPLDADPSPAFAQLVQISHDIRANHPQATMISAGMSGDFAAAIAAGATHLRIGRSILGERPPLG